MAEDALAGGNITVGVDEAAGGGGVITGLQIVQTSLLALSIANEAKMDWFLLFPEGVFLVSNSEQCHSEEGEARRGNPFLKRDYGLPRAFSPRNDIRTVGAIHESPANGR